MTTQSQIHDFLLLIFCPDGRTWPQHCLKVMFNGFLTQIWEMFHEDVVHPDSTASPEVLPLAHWAVNILLNILPSLFYWERPELLRPCFFQRKLKLHLNWPGTVTRHIIQLGNCPHRGRWCAKKYHLLHCGTTATIIWPSNTYFLSPVARWTCAAAAHLLQGSLSGATRDAPVHTNVVQRGRVHICGPPSMNECSPLTAGRDCWLHGS